MNRYRHQRIKLDKENGNRKLSSIEYAKILPKDSDISYVVKYGDSYGSLANRFYNDTTLWWVIARANGEFQGNIKPKIGQRIIIPIDISDTIRELNNLNSSRE
tara:strand:- start:698 stop:1006 length:309 start_codon:yes stop_codon:yes gene_type:complete